MLKGFTVSDVVMKEIPVIDANASVREAAAKLLEGQNKNFVVYEGGRPAGTLSRDQIIKALGENGEHVSVAKVKDDDMVILSPDMPLEEAWLKLQQEKKPLMLVMREGRIEGVVDRENVAEFILIQTAAHNRSKIS
jgi:CBS domain-containing protein